MNYTVTLSKPDLDSLLILLENDKEKAERDGIHYPGDTLALRLFALVRNQTATPVTEPEREVLKQMAKGKCIDIRRDNTYELDGQLLPHDLVNLLKSEHRVVCPYQPGGWPDRLVISDFGRRDIQDDIKMG